MGVCFNTIMHIICPIILIILTVCSVFGWIQNIVAQVQLAAQTFHVYPATKGAAGRSMIGEPLSVKFRHYYLHDSTFILIFLAIIHVVSKHENGIYCRNEPRWKDRKQQVP
jgi:hypothetical protein